MWLTYTLATIALWGLWGLLGKLALRSVTWVQASLFFGAAAVAVCVALLAAGERKSAWSPGDLWIPALTGLVGAIGLTTFYLALEQGKASVVIPLIGLYPIVAAVLSVAVLGESLSAMQIAGVALAVVAIALLAAGG
jgi:transporter family protein